MRLLPVLALVLPLAAGCAPYMPMRADFGTSAAVPKGDIPPEFAGFNAYDAAVNPVLAQQLCATRYQPRSVTTLDAQPGQMVTTQGACANHVPFFGN